MDLKYKATQKVLLYFVIFIFVSFSLSIYSQPSRPVSDVSNVFRDIIAYRLKDKYMILLVFPYNNVDIKNESSLVKIISINSTKTALPHRSVFLIVSKDLDFSLKVIMTMADSGGKKKVDFTVKLTKKDNKLLVDILGNENLGSYTREYSIFELRKNKVLFISERAPLACVERSLVPHENASSIEGEGNKSVQEVTRSRKLLWPNFFWYIMVTAIVIVAGLILALIVLRIKRKSGASRKQVIYGEMEYV